jgi:hypothetical protein
MNTPCISKNHFSLRGMAASEWMRSGSAITDTLVADYSVPGINTIPRIAYCPLITVPRFVIALSVTYFKLSLWH